MATLQRSVVFRRQGSSGPVWDERYVVREDQVEYRELRPCQSARNIAAMDCSRSGAAPTTCPRSLSTPANDQTLSEVFGNHVASIPKSKSGKSKLLANVFSGNK